MRTFNVPKKEEVSTQNQAIFDQLESAVGFVPNLYATYAYSDSALERYLAFANGKTSLTLKEKEIVNLAVSQVNGCDYCLSAHTAIGTNAGFSADEIIEFRTGASTKSTKYNALASLAKNLTEQRGTAKETELEAFFSEGYSEEQFIDLIVQVGEKTISNYVHNATQVPIDFPLAPALTLETV